ncbi:hypothetical protein C1645_746608 [Glomus cerebriforme]|uniref:Uncharacterized protein n=1 Tax=Glomus cerebriforme TaxID=658196 RepID=A0A397TNI6_9GLOM|nr:hypothetical protein C1645_746608 [Glomus cerebriforme]
MYVKKIQLQYKYLYNLHSCKSISVFFSFLIINNITMSCVITGDTDIIGPGVRISVYIQCLLALFKTLAKGEEAIESISVGVITSFSLVVSSLAGNLHPAFLLDVSQFVSLLMIANAIAYKTLTYDNCNKYIKKLYFTTLFYTVVDLLIICYNIWLWTTIKWKLPAQPCGHDVKFFLFFFPLDPSGWIRIIILISNYFALLPSLKSVIWILLPFIFALHEHLNPEKPDNPNMSANLDPNVENIDDLENPDILNILDLERPKSLEEKSNNSEHNNSENDDQSQARLGLACCLLVISVPLMAIFIASTEVSVQKNPISNIWDWGFGQVMALVLAVADAIRTIIVVYDNVSSVI